MAHRDAVEPAKRDAVELAGGPHHRVAHRLELEVRLDRVVVEVVLRLADLLGVEPVVPRRDPAPRHRSEGSGRLAGGLGGRAGRRFGVGDLLHVGDLLARARDRRLPHLHRERERCLRRARHVVVDRPVRVARVAEQARALGAQREDLGDHRAVVVLAGVLAAADPHPPRLLAQIASRRVDQERLDRRSRVGDQPARALARLGDLAQRVAQRLGEAGEVGLARELERMVLLVGELVLAEPRVERREPRVDRGEPRLALGVERGALAREAAIDDLDEPEVLADEPAGVARVVHRLDPREQRRVLADLVVERREHRRQILLELQHVVVGHRRGVDAEHAGRALERPARGLERDDRVVERRRRGVGRDRSDLGAHQIHRGDQPRLELVDADLIEAREPAVRAGPGSEDRPGHRIRGHRIIWHGASYHRSGRRAMAALARTRRRRAGSPATTARRAAAG
jgi:hypothetical protein